MAVNCEILLIAITYGYATSLEKIPSPYTSFQSAILQQKKLTFYYQNQRQIDSVELTWK